MFSLSPLNVNIPKGNNVMAHNLQVVNGAAEGTIHITGTTGVGVAMGFYYYIKKYCNAHISWAGDQVNLPDTIPKVPDAGSP